MRTYDSSQGTSLETWIAKKAEWAIKDGLRRERTRAVSLDVMIEDFEFDVADCRGWVDPNTEAMWDEVAKLSDADQDLVHTYLATGNIDKTAKAIGMPQAVARRRMTAIRKILSQS